MAQHWNSEVLDDNHQKRRAGVLVARQPVVDPSECLLAQGFSVTLESKVHAESTSFDVPRVFPRTRSAMFMQAGNAMNVHMIGLALVWALVFPNHPPQTQTGPSSSSSSVEGKKDAKKCETKEKQTLVARDFFALTSGKRPRV